MKRWLKIGAALLLVAWAPFLYAELTSEPAEKKARQLPSDDGEEPVAPQAAAGHAAEPEKAAPAPGALAAEEQEAEEPAAEPAAEPPVQQPAAPPAAQAPAQPGAQGPAAEPAEHEELAEGEEEAQQEEAPPPMASGPTAALKQAYETEPRDALWATDTERRIAAVFNGEDVPEGMLQRTSCRRAVCSLELRWTRDHATQYVGAFQALSDQFGGEIGVEPVGGVDDEGQQTVHLYLLRKGYTAADVAK